MAALGVEMDYLVDITARIGEAASDARLGDRLLTALESTAVAPAVGQDSSAGTIGAAFTVDAEDPSEALAQARATFAAALAGITGGEADFVELHVSEVGEAMASP